MIVDQDRRRDGARSAQGVEEFAAILVLAVDQPAERGRTRRRQREAFFEVFVDNGDPAIESHDGVGDFDRCPFGIEGDGDRAEKGRRVERDHVLDRIAGQNRDVIALPESPRREETGEPDRAVREFPVGERNAVDFDEGGLVGITARAEREAARHAGKALVHRRAHRSGSLGFLVGEIDAALL